MGIITMQEIEYVTATDIDRKIEVRKDIGLLYEEDGEYKTLRTDFMQSFGTVENYMMTACESINLEQFSQESQDLMKNDEYNGKYVYKIVLEDGKVIPHYYTFIGFDSDTDITVVPVKIPLENKYTVDPRKVISTSWYYLESNEDIEYIQTKDIVEKLCNSA